jgi:hypothetical protein
MKSAETRKVTVTLGQAQLYQIRSLVQEGRAPSVSGFVRISTDTAGHCAGQQNS